jgi:hypothetical protein
MDDRAVGQSILGALGVLFAFVVRADLYTARKDRVVAHFVRLYDFKPLVGERSGNCARNSPDNPHSVIPPQILIWFPAAVPSARRLPRLRAYLAYSAPFAGSVTKYTIKPCKKQSDLRI